MDLLRIPFDILKNHIVDILPKFSLVSMTLVSHKWHSLALRCRHWEKREIVLSLFRDGAPVSLISWFERFLSYPGFASESSSLFKWWQKQFSPDDLTVVNFGHSTDVLITVAADGTSDSVRPLSLSLPLLN
jgi:hypothetical protein